MKTNKRNGEKEKLEGLYSNSFKIGYNAFEFVIDFGQLYSGSVKSSDHTRIVTGPAYAKAFLELFNKVFKEYEARFGEIDAKYGDPA